MRNVKDVLTDEVGLDLTGWTLRQARGISADGLTIAGWGTNPAGYSEAWITYMPEPATLCLLAVSGLAAMRGRSCLPL